MASISESGPEGDGSLEISHEASDHKVTRNVSINVFGHQPLYALKASHLHSVGSNAQNFKIMPN